MDRIVFVTRGTDEDVCSVCLGSVRRRVFRTPCGHHYHCKCLRRHMERSSRCPMCRADLPDLPHAPPRHPDDVRDDVHMYRDDDDLLHVILAVERVLASWRRGTAS